MIDQLQELQEELLIAVTNSAVFCDVERVTVTAGEPPASGCTAIWLWGTTLEDELALLPGCAVRPRATIQYRIDICYEVTEAEETDEIHQAAADCLYDLMNLVWCHLLDLKTHGQLLGGTCDKTDLLPLVVGQRQGGTVSATGGVVFDYSC